MTDYGWGLRVNDAGSIQLDRNGKIEIVDDINNLGQQLSLRLKSIRGSHVFDPTFGMDINMFIEYKKFYRDIRELIEVVVMQCLSESNHVKKVDYVLATPSEDRNWRVDVKVITKDDNSIHFSSLIQESGDISRFIEIERI